MYTTYYIYSLYIYMSITQSSSHANKRKTLSVIIIVNFSLGIGRQKINQT